MNLLNIIKFLVRKSVVSILFLACTLIGYSFFTSCIDEISLKIPSSIENRITIFGSVTRSDPSVVSVFVGRVGAVGVNSTNIPEAIEGTEVMLVGEDGSSIVLEKVEPPGNFYLEIPEGNPGFKIEIGKSYKISVVTLENRRYESAFEEIIPVPQPESINVKFEKREELSSAENIVTKNYIQFFVNTPLERPDGKGRVHLKWDVFGVYQFRTLPLGLLGIRMICYIPQQLGSGTAQVFDGTDANNKKLANHMILETNSNHRFSWGFHLTAYQQSLTDNAFDYWNRVRESTSLNGNMFEAAPGKIKGNIINLDDPQEEVLGYFFASDQALIRRFVDPEEANLPVEFCNGQRLRRADAVCLNCLVWPNSTLEIPAYWGK